MRALSVITLFALSSSSYAVQLGGNAVCKLVAKAISPASAVFYPGSSQYDDDNRHWAQSSGELAACSVQPGTAKDVGSILRLLGLTRTPFAVKGGGHSYNAGWSSTTGVLISTTRFNEVTYKAATSSAIVGAGNTWQRVYDILGTSGVTVVGGRISPVGVSGLLLGGGYSWLTNQHGLALDNILAFELVLPSGEVVNVNEKTHADLWFAVRGGWNNFGVVTKFTLKAYPQGPVWGGTLVHLPDQEPMLKAAALDFFKNTDPKAGLLFSYGWTNGTYIVVTNLFYDGPSPPVGLFDAFTSVPPILADVSTRSYPALIASVSAGPSTRVVHNAVANTKYSSQYISAFLNETIFWGTTLSQSDPSATLFYSLEPFLPSILLHGSNSAYPASRDRALLPTSIQYSYELSSADSFMRSAIAQTTRHLQKLAVFEGQPVSLNNQENVVYGNYADASTPSQHVFGDNLWKMKLIKLRYDPLNVMGLAGGWKV